MSARSVGVLVVEDSATVRAFLAGAIAADADLCLVGEAASGDEGVRAVLERRPDVVVMDINMPGTDGVEATRRVMDARPTPIVVFCSRSDPAGVARSFDALGAGALAIVEKPAPGGARGPKEAVSELVARIKVVAGVRPVRRRAPDRSAMLPLRGDASSPRARGPEVLAIAASTGGPATLVRILSALPAPLPVPVLVAQHMTPGFVRGLVEWLARETGHGASVAVAGESPRAGRVYFAEDDRDLAVDAARRLVTSAPRAGATVRPSADVLFASVAAAYGPSAVGVVLTGMGSDGAAGLAEVRRRGGATVAQSPGTCVVAGMPESAVRAGAVQNVVPLELLAHRIRRLVSGRRDGGVP